jgi:hypothetical protein
MSYLGQQPTVGIQRSEFFSGDNTTTTFNLAFPYGNEASVLVFISGVKQKVDSYAVINGQIVFLTAPPSGTENIEVIYLSERTIQNPYLSADFLWYHTNQCKRNNRKHYDYNRIQCQLGWSFDCCKQYRCNRK